MMGIVGGAGKLHTVMMTAIDRISASQNIPYDAKNNVKKKKI